MFLAAIFFVFGKSVTAAMVVQAILSGLSAVLIYKISSRIGFPRLVGLGAALLFALEPMSAITSNSILTETLFLLLLLLFFYLFIGGLAKDTLSGKRTFLLGLILGFGILVRPVLYPYLVVIALFLLVYLGLYKKVGWATAVKTLILGAVGVYSLVFPWILRNKIVFNTWSISSISGTHLLYSYAAPFYAYKQGTADKDLVIRQFFEKMGRDVVGDKYDLRNNPLYYRFAKEIIKEDPLGYTFFHLSHTVSFFTSNGYRNIGRELGFHSSSPPENYSFIRLLLAGKIDGLFKFFRENISYFAVFFSGAIIWLVINIFMLAGIVKGLFEEEDKRRQLFILFFAATIAYFAVTAGPEAYYKMRFPVNPFIFMLAFYGFSNLLFPKIKYELQ
jgi:hypothetical protein